MFPYKLSMLDHLKDDKRIKFKQETVKDSHGNEYKFTIVSYMVADSTLWQLENALECRGITYNEHGLCVSAPFQKFFNLNENQFTQYEDIKNWDRIAVLDKRDGSMITPVLLSSGYSKEVAFKSKKSFYSSVAEECYFNAPDNVKQLSLHLLEQHLTPIFEYTSPNNQIVIDYGDQSKFTLLAVRDNIKGEYWPQYQVDRIGKQFDVSVIEMLDHPVDQMIVMAQTLSGIEGWVVVNALNWFDRVKIKCAEYLRMHRVRTEFRERDCAVMVIDETIDDVKSSVVNLGYSLEPIEQIESKVVSELSAIREYVERVVVDNKAMDRKSFAMQFKNDVYFGLLMKQYVGDEPDYKGYWKRHVLPRYSLFTIYSDFGSDP